jgi:Aspartyl/Asparaginyl beta-hydroxylase
VTAAAIPDSLRLPFSFDAGLLKRDLDKISSEDWVAHYIRDRYEGDWSAIPLRFAAGARHPIQMIYADPAAKEFEDAPMLASCGYFREVLAAFECTIACVRLLRLAPGALLKEHMDIDLAFEFGAVRIHIPIVTNPDVEFVLNGHALTMLPGEAWYLNLTKPHSAANKGESDRVHLVIDASANAWLDALMRAGVAGRETASYSEAEEAR